MTSLDTSRKCRARSNECEAVKRGGRVVRPVDADGPVTLAVFADPEGHVIGLVKEEAAAPS